MARPPATADVQAFKLNVWDNIQSGSRCGNCHAQGGIGNGYFARNDDVNLAYQEANVRADLALPSNSLLVSKLSAGHNCWLTSDAACADIMTTWIEGWAGATSGGGRQIVLEAPNPVPPGDSRSYANATPEAFRDIRLRSCGEPAIHRLGAVLRRLPQLIICDRTVAIFC